MTLSRVARLCATLATAAIVACCSRRPADDGPIAASSKTLTVSGEYHRAQIDSVEHIAIDGNKLVLEGGSSRVAVDLPPGADPEHKNRGWALVTEGEDDPVRTLTFTHESSLDDFTIQVPDSPGQIEYGSIGGPSSSDLLLFAYGSSRKCYWGWVTIAKR